jgi:putative selenate reductase
MAELTPFPFGKLASRMFRELELKRAIFDLPEKKFFLGEAGRDFSVRFHGLAASSPIGPAAGPQSQLAQNIVLSWLGGCRIMELKTVQIMDELKIPRPCIDIHNVGYNVEWSQELKLRQSLEEYVKASMLIEILTASKKLPLAPGFGRVIYDMSVGYDLKGIQSAPVQDFIRGMTDAAELVEKFRKQIPDELKKYRDLDFTTALSRTLTLSTFHGCPPDEIEKIIDFLLRNNELNCVIKFNPTLLGKAELRRLLHDVMGYKELHTPDASFDKDTKWAQAVDMVGRLKETAKSCGLSLGAKFSNTLIVENHRKFFTPDNKEMYMSGPPLHVLALNLVKKFRGVFGGEVPVSFAAGIDKQNVADAVSLGMAPITVCSDLLKTGGYGRLESYFRELIKRMDAVGASSVRDFILRAHGQAGPALKKALEKVEASKRGPLEKFLAAPPSVESTPDALKRWARDNGLSGQWADDFYRSWVREAALLNTGVVADKVTADPRYRKEANSRDPQKVGSKLELFNCITCDKCVQVCPNDANFAFTLPQIEVPVAKLKFDGGGAPQKVDAGKLVFNKKHQIGNFADFCNECGNCDVYCPEDGGPYVLKPRFFGSKANWELYKTHDGFFLEKGDGYQMVFGRFSGREFSLIVRKDGGGAFTALDSGLGVGVKGDDVDLSAVTRSPGASGEVDLTYFHIMNWLRKALFSEQEVTYVNA